MREHLVEQLAGIVGAGHVLDPGETSQAADVAGYCTDWRGRYHGLPLCVLRPGTRDELVRCVRACAAAQVPMVPQGGNTSLCGAATPIGGEVLINLCRLDRVLELDAQNNTITVQAGALLQRVQEAAAAADRLFPLSLASEGSATIGGNLSTNAGGVQVLRYGSMRDLTLGIEVVLANGEVWNGLRALRKDNTGYDLKQLFIGAEGTLGFITAATLKLFPRPRHTLTAWVTLADPGAAVRLLAHLRAYSGDALSAFELIGAAALSLTLAQFPTLRPPLPATASWHVLLEFSAALPFAQSVDAALAEALAQGLIGDAVLATTLAQASELWALRENISAAQKREGLSIKHDISLPISAIDRFIRDTDAALRAAFPGVRIICFGHVGDGNLHYNLSHAQGADNAALMACSEQANRIVHDRVALLGGSISAEHGLGQLKREEITRYKTPVEMALMRRIKQALDPHGLMNPGKLLASA